MLMVAMPTMADDYRSLFTSLSARMAYATVYSTADDMSIDSGHIFAHAAKIPSRRSHGGIRRFRDD